MGADFSIKTAVPGIGIHSYHKGKTVLDHSILIIGISIPVRLHLLLTRTTRTPVFWGHPLLPHDHPYHWVLLDPKSKEDKVKVTNLKNSSKLLIFQVWNRHNTRQTFVSCLIRCAHMNWIRWVLLKTQSGHDSVHRRTDGQTDKVKPVYPPFNLDEVGGIINK